MLDRYWEILPDDLKELILKDVPHPLNLRLSNKGISTAITPLLSGKYGNNLKQNFFKTKILYNFAEGEAVTIALKMYLKNAKNEIHFNEFVAAHFKSCLNMFSTKTRKTHLGGYSQFTKNEADSIILASVYINNIFYLNEENYTLANKISLELLRTIKHPYEFFKINIMELVLFNDKDKQILINSLIENMQSYYDNFRSTEWSLVQERSIKNFIEFAIRNKFGHYMENKQRAAFFKLLVKFNHNYILPTDFFSLFNSQINMDKEFFSKIFCRHLDYDCSGKAYLTPIFKEYCKDHSMLAFNLLSQEHQKIFLSLVGKNILSNLGIELVTEDFEGISKMFV